MQAQTKAIWGIVNRGDNKKAFWTRIGTAYVNRDGSLNLRFHFLPADLASTTIQVRDQQAGEPKAEPTAETEAVAA